MYLELSFELGSLDSEAAEAAAHACGALAVSFVDATTSSPPVLEPAPGELRLWAATLAQCLFEPPPDLPALARSLAAALGLDVTAIGARWIADRDWEREWLRDFHALRFGRRLWVCPHHERVRAEGAVVVALDPGLAFGTGTHPSTALCLEFLDAHLAPGCCVIDYGCGSGVLALAAVKLGARVAHCCDRDAQALIATRANAQANGIAARVQVHEDCAALPLGVDVLLANILAAPLCDLAPRFAALVRPGGQVVLAGIMEHELAQVTGAYAACFDVSRFGGRDDWVCLTGRRHSRAPQ